MFMLQAISEKVGEQRELQKQGQDIQLELKEMEHKVSKFQRDSKEAATKVSFLLSSFANSWPVLRINRWWKEWNL